MQTFKQSFAAVALVATLGLILPGLFVRPTLAEISNKNPQQMTIKCDLDGKSTTGANGYEYESNVIAIDHDPGGKRLGKMQDTNSNLQFLPIEGTVSTIWTAIEDNRYWTEDSSHYAWVPLSPADAAIRLADNYPAVWETPPGYPFSYFGDGFSAQKGVKKSIAACVVTDDGLMDAREAERELGSSQCLGENGPQDLCYENRWVADDMFDVTDSQPCLVNGAESLKCMNYVADDPATEANEEVIVTYHYTDIFTIKAQVIKSSTKALSAKDAGKHRAHKGKHHGKGKRGR